MEHYKKIHNLFSYKTKGQEILNFGNIENERNTIYYHKTSILGGDRDIEKMLVSNKISFSEKIVFYWLLA